MTHAYDGHPDQAGLEAVRQTGRDPGMSLVGLREGVVVRRYFVDEDGNRSRTYVEYDVRDLGTGQIVTGCRRIQAVSGVLDGSDDILHPATKTRDSTKVLSTRSRAKDTDGDQVLYGFLEGSWSRPVILGVLDSDDKKYGAKKEDGERRYGTFQGTSWRVDKDGHIHVKHKKGFTVDITDDGVAVDAGDKKCIVKANEIDLNATVKVGDGASEAQVLGDTLKTILTTLINTITSMSMTVAGAAATLSPAEVAKFTVVSNTLSQFLSQTNKVK